ncbi:MAG: cytochrome b5-like heme/steroid binding domain-containing protein [Patescibacteria group bacterium]
MKKEIITGIIGSILVLSGTGYDAARYQRQTQFLNPNSPQNSFKDSPPSSQNGALILSEDEITKHDTPQDCWMVIEENVYAVTAYKNLHPGGAQAITSYCGTDATQAFLIKGGKGSHSATAKQQHAVLLIGKVGAQVSPAAIQNAAQNASRLPPAGERGDEYEREEERE